MKNMKKFLLLGITVLAFTGCASSTTSSSNAAKNSQVSSYSHIDTTSTGPEEQPPLIGFPRL